MDPKPPRPGLRAHWTWIGVLCTLLASVGGRFLIKSPREVPPPRPAAPEGDRLRNEAPWAGRALDLLRPHASDSPATQRRANEAATRTYADSTPARDERRAPSRRPPPPRPLLFTPAPPRPLLFTPAPPRPLLFTPAPPRPLLFTPAPAGAPQSR